MAAGTNSLFVGMVGVLKKTSSYLAESLLTLEHLIAGSTFHHIQIPYSGGGCNDAITTSYFMSPRFPFMDLAIWYLSHTSALVYLHSSVLNYYHH
jgi:hypothetical protein